jgi:hypothetical protein
MSTLFFFYPLTVTSKTAEPQRWSGQKRSGKMVAGFMPPHV